MKINFNKNDVSLEHSSSKYLCVKTKENFITKTPLSFEGTTGFNETYVYPILMMCAKGDVFYRYYKIEGDLMKDKTVHTARFVTIANIRQTNFLFQSLRNIGVSLNTLRFGFEDTDPEHPILYLDTKIISYFSRADKANVQQFCMFFISLGKLFKALNEEVPNVTLDTMTSEIQISDVDMSKFKKSYTDLPEELSIEYASIAHTNDVEFTFNRVSYYNNLYTGPITKNVTAEIGNNYKYNVIKDSKKERLVLIQTAFKLFYILDITEGKVYTNCELQENNVFSTTEFLLNMISKIQECNPTIPRYTVSYLTLDKLLSTKEPEISITNDASNFEDFLEKFPNISENNDMKFYEGYFVGVKINKATGVDSLADLYKGDEYAQELYKQVQEYYVNFDLKDLAGIVKGIAKGDIISMLFEGESGTGKSTAARVLASRCGLPFVSINCSTNIEESDIFGTMIPNPTKSSADDPEFIWQDGPASKAIRNGYFLIIEEINFARPGVIGKLNSLLDEARQVELPNGEIIKAHPNFRLAATMNNAYEGTNRLNKALIDRFEICKKFTDLDQKEALAVITERTGYTDTVKMNKVYDVYRAIKKYSDEQNLGLVISIRKLLVLFKQGKYYKNAKDASSNLLLNQAFLEEPEHLKFFTDTVLKAHDLSFKI